MRQTAEGQYQPSGPQPELAAVPVASGGGMAPVSSEQIRQAAGNVPQPTYPDAEYRTQTAAKVVLQQEEAQRGVTKQAVPAIPVSTSTGSSGGGKASPSSYLKGMAPVSPVTVERQLEREAGGTVSGVSDSGEPELVQEAWNKLEGVVVDAERHAAYLQRQIKHYRDDPHTKFYGDVAWDELTGEG